MLYGISAKKQTGKDLFLKIWNALALVKDGSPLTDSEIEELRSDIIDHGAEYFGKNAFKKKYFARPLKEICSILFGCSVEDFESEQFKETEIPEEWLDNKLGVRTYREALQYIGTEMFRNTFHQDTWVLSSLSGYCEDDRWFITDVRFPNEKLAIEKAGGKVIRIDSTSISSDTHPSETALDNAEFDIRILNNFIFEDYTRKIYEIMISEGVFDKNK